MNIVEKTNFFCQDAKDLKKEKALTHRSQPKGFHHREGTPIRAFVSIKSEKFLLLDSSLPSATLHNNAWLHGGFGYKICFLLELELIFMTNSPREEVMSAVRSKKPTAKIKSLESYCTNICAILNTNFPACRYCRIQVE